MSGRGRKLRTVFSGPPGTCNFAIREQCPFTGKRARSRDARPRKIASLVITGFILGTVARDHSCLWLLLVNRSSHFPVGVSRVFVNVITDRILRVLVFSGKSWKKTETRSKHNSMNIQPPLTISIEYKNDINLLLLKLYISSCIRVERCTRNRGKRLKLVANQIQRISSHLLQFSRNIKIYHICNTRSQKHYDCIINHLLLSEMYIPSSIQISLCPTLNPSQTQQILLSSLTTPEPLSKENSERGIHGTRAFPLEKFAGWSEAIT